MIAFASFAVPVVFAAVLLICMVVGITCIWDMWHRSPQPLSYSPESEWEIPQIWDLVTEYRGYSEYGDITWEKVVPFSVARITPERHGATLLSSPSHKQAQKVAEMGDQPSSMSRDHLQIAVAIAMPCPLPKLNSPIGNETEAEWPVYCIGVHHATLKGSELQ
ncbi:hypothetical protein C8R43DRAFT_1042938 [Mycena crocata]|nr:hypothetical protein C8R43DRAFT_1042938 [Mycena crocata]